MDKLSGAKIRRMHQQASRYCNSLMATDLCGIQAENRTMAHAMAYLCLLDEAYQCVNQKDDCTVWMTTFTLIGLLRAATHFRDFAWVSSLYEGGDMGEGIIKILRPLSPTGIRDGWSLNLLEGYYRRITMGVLLGSVNGKPEQISSAKVIDRTKFVRYNSLCVVQDKIQKKEVLSLLFFFDEVENKTFMGCMIQQCDHWYFRHLSHSVTPLHVDKHGYTYFDIEVSEEEDEMIDKSVPTIRPGIIGFWKTGFALPLYWRDCQKNGYCFLSDEGSCLDRFLNWQTML